LTTVFDLVVGKALTELSIGDYAPIREEYRLNVWAAITDYLFTEDARVTRFKNSMKKAMTTAFHDAFSQGIQDGGGDYLNDPDPADVEWLAAKQAAEFGYIDSLFLQLKSLKSEAKEDPTATEGEAERRAEGYARTLDGIYSEGKIRGAKNIMLTFGGEDGYESCPECQKMKGKRHKASWWIKRNLVPGQPGNESYSCKGYNCRHFLYDDKGNVWTA
jgi:hypothetical protein